MNNDIFVKLNYKTIGEFKSLIIDRQHTDNENNKYLMCTGKYNKDGWTFVFKANSIKEAEDFISKNSEKKKREISINPSIVTIPFIEEDKVSIPTWM